jgi:NTE family protein
LVNPVPVNVVREMGADFVIAVNLNRGVVRGEGPPKPTSEPPPPDRDAPTTDARNRISQALATRMARVKRPVLDQLSRWRSRDPLPSIFDVMITSIGIMETRITMTRLEREPPDLLIEPRVGHLRSMEFHRAGEAILEGYREATHRLAGLST